MTPPRLFAIAVMGALVSAGLYVLAHPVALVFMLHAIVADPLDPLDVSPERFRAFVQHVRASGQPALFTTDSSDRSIFDVYAVVLQEHRQPGLVFLLPPAVGRPGMLTWDQVRALDGRGLIMGSHTLTHPWLPDLTEEEIRCEVCHSKRWIEQELGHAITALAYPYGAYDDRVRRLATACGYTEAYATAPGRRVRDDDPLAIKRVPIMESVLRHGWREWLAMSGYAVTLRELALAGIPIEVPRKPRDWSYAAWKESAVPTCRARMGRHP